MDKKEFVTWFTDRYKQQDEEAQVTVLDEIIQYASDMRKAKMDRLAVNKTRCIHCKKYSLKEKFIEEVVTENRFEKTHTGTGYGDPDMYGSVKYEIGYRLCPICGSKEELTRKRIAILWERKDNQ